MTALKRVVAVAVAAMPISQLAGLGLSAVVVVAVLAAMPVVAVVGLAFWVIGDDQRSDRARRLLTAARRVDGGEPASAPMQPGRWSRWRRRRVVWMAHRRR